MSKSKLDFDPDFGKKVRLLRVGRGMNQSQFAQLMGFTKNTVGSVEKGGRPSERFMQQIAMLEAEEQSSVLDQKSNGVRRDVQLDSGIGNAVIVKTRNIPVVSWAQAGLATDYDELPLDWQRTVPTMMTDEKAFAVQIAGDSMEPRYHAGDVAYLSPSSPVYQNDTVIARLADQGVVFKIYSRKGDTVTLSSYNPAYSPFDVPVENISWVYPVHFVMKILGK